MSVRATWSDTLHVDVEVTDEFVDQYSSEIDEGNIALIFGQDQDCFVIEGASTEDIRDLLERIETKLQEWDDAHPE